MQRRVIVANCSSGFIVRAVEGGHPDWLGRKEGGECLGASAPQVAFIPTAHTQERCFNALCSSPATRKARLGSAFRFLCGSNFCAQQVTILLRRETSTAHTQRYSAVGDLRIYC